jgi:hypothetical protein
MHEKKYLPLHRAEPTWNVSPTAVEAIYLQPLFNITEPARGLPHNALFSVLLHLLEGRKDITGTCISFQLAVTLQTGVTQS